MTGTVTASTTRVTSPNPFSAAGVNARSQASQATAPNAIANREILAMDGLLRQRLGAGYQSGNTAVSQSGKQGKALFEMLAANHAQISAVAAKAQAGDPAAQQFIAAFNARLSRLGQALDSTSWYTGTTKASAVLNRMFSADAKAPTPSGVAQDSVTAAEPNQQLTSASTGVNGTEAEGQVTGGDEQFLAVVQLIHRAATAQGIPESSLWAQSLRAMKSPEELITMINDDRNLEGLSQDQRTTVTSIRTAFNEKLKNER